MLEVWSWWCYRWIEIADAPLQPRWGSPTSTPTTSWGICEPLLLSPFPYLLLLCD